MLYGHGLTPVEQEVLHLLLTTDFDGAPALLCQVEGIVVTRVAVPGGLRVRLRPAKETPAASVKYDIPVEASAIGVDGASIWIALKVADGRLASLEILRLDGVIHEVPPLTSLTVHVPGPLGEWERAVLARILSADVAGVSALRAQAVSAEGYRIDTGAGMMIYLSVDPASPVSALTGVFPLSVDAVARDGTSVEIILHVAEGRLRIIEVYRIDGEPLGELPSPESLTMGHG